MSSHLDWQRPLPSLADVPIEGRVGAMAALGNQMPDTFKPYVYRGWDIDVLTDLPPVRQPVTYKPVKPRPRRPRQRLPQPISRPIPAQVDPDLAVAAEAAQRAAALLAEWEKPKPVKRKKKKHKKPKPVPKPKPRQVAVRPSPGWKPMTGADIDALLDGLE